MFASIATSDKQPLNSVSISGNGKYIATGGVSRSVLIYDYQTKKQIAECCVHSNTINSIQWTPDNRQIVSGAEDASLCVWNCYA